METQNKTQNKTQLLNEPERSNASERNKKRPKSPRRRRVRILVIILAVIAAAYIILLNVIVSAALVPSFMERLTAFERVTEQNLDDLVSTEDIEENNSKAWDRIDAWLEEVSADRLTLESEDGYELVAAEFPLKEAKEDSHKWVLILHGYTGYKEEMLPAAYQYYKEGYHVVLPDMRCEGESEGDFIGMGYLEAIDNMLWLDYILEQDPEAEIVIHGQSMGAATALIMSGMEEIPSAVKVIISDCAYASAFAMFQDKAQEWLHLPRFLVGQVNGMLQLRGGYDLHDAAPIDYVADSTVPTLFIHGTEDAMVDVQDAYDLFEAEAADKMILIIDGAGHGQASDKEPKRYWRTIRRFISTHTDWEEE